MERTGGSFAEQVIRPTGLIDPVVEVRPVAKQVDDLLSEVRRVRDAGGRVLVTTLTKRMAEDLTEYLTEQGVRVRYLHSDVDTLERIEIIRNLRLGVFDVLVGINLLREGLDIPECMLVAILDADKEGFLRSQTSLIQTIGRAARNVDGRVICYADVMTRSLRAALEETDRRRQKQEAWNTAHGITPVSVRKHIGQVLDSVFEQDYVTVAPVKDAGVAELVGRDLRSSIAEIRAPHAGGGSGSGIRGGGAPARRTQAAGGAGTRDRAAAVLGLAGEARLHAGAFGARRRRLRPRQAARPRRWPWRRPRETMKIDARIPRAALVTGGGRRLGRAHRRGHRRCRLCRRDSLPPERSGGRGPGGDDPCRRRPGGCVAGPTSPRKPRSRLSCPAPSRSSARWVFSSTMPAPSSGTNGTT